MIIRKFLEWFRIKGRRDSNRYDPPLIREGEIWWCSLGENVGIESCGKGVRFTRPIIVLKKFGRLAVLGIPTATKKRTGSWYVPLTHKGVSFVAMLAQTRTFSYQRLDRRIGRLDDKDFKQIKEAFVRLLYE